MDESYRFNVRDDNGANHGSADTVDEETCLEVLNGFDAIKSDVH